MQRIVFTLFKLAIGVTCMFLLFYYELIDFQLLGTALDSPSLVITSFLLLLSTVFIGALRWQLLISALATPITFKQSLSYTFVGQFFNVFLPGAYGGDFIRGALAYQHNANKLPEIIMSSLVDRVSGLFGLLLVALIFLGFVPSEHQFWIGVMASVGCGIVILAPLFLLHFGAVFLSVARAIPGLVGRILLRILEKLIELVSAYRTKFSVLVMAVGLSLIQWFLILTALFLIGQAMNADGLSWVGYVVSGVAGLLANAIPISPGGLGVGEAAFAQVSQLLEAVPTQTAYGSIFLVQRALTVLTVAMGIIPFIMYRREVKIAKQSTLTNERQEG